MKIIEAQKIATKGDSNDINLLEFYDALIKTKDKSLLETYSYLYTGM